jgi:hypothetical protein
VLTRSESTARTSRHHNRNRLPPIAPVTYIPPMTLSGALPPYVGAATMSHTMSPYMVTLLDIAQRFCHTPHRSDIMRGLLQHRQELSSIGLVDGFVWLAGSFFEEIEKTDNRNPNDIDVVLFLKRPASHSLDLQWSQFLNQNLPTLHPQQTKARFKCDVQIVDLGLDPRVIVDRTRFWFGLFSHRRDNLWKGILQVPLPLSADDAATNQHLSGI